MSRLDDDLSNHDVDVDDAALNAHDGDRGAPPCASARI
jgi:hypothetical protein